MKVLIIEGSRHTLMPEGPEIERRVLGSEVDVEWYGVVSAEESASILEDADAAIVRPGTPFTAQMVRSLKKARVLVSLGVGYEHIDIEAAARMGLPVCNVPDYGTEEVADSTVAMLLALQRKINLFQLNPEFSEWDWRIHIPIQRSRELQVGIIGLGRIGTAVAMRLKSFGHRICFYDPYIPRGIEKALGLMRLYDRDELLRSSNIISIHTPLTKETDSMVNENFLELLKPDAILINTARGKIFKSMDLIYRFLREKPEFRMGTDVLPIEPPPDHPLLTAFKNREPWLKDRLIICPHTAFYSKQACVEMRRFAAEIVQRVLTGHKPYNVVNEVT